MKRNPTWYHNIANTDICYKDLDKYYQIRTNANNLTKIKIYKNTRYADNVSHRKFMTKLWGYKYDHYDGPKPYPWYYIGPMDESDEMIDKLNITLSVVDVEDDDILPLVSD